ncbi:hypothetical protein MUU53_22630 [Rhizobium lemnae]|uniref:Uncharacterized protein n=1 Tax=Rhizobium lemnae TaxID=1214924 RepID=A0ABV8EBB3_9HYPH|nr:hypothetical protein [Rhizobium lemnae]MCJ8510654.1 hypothetical protein [Rhizobium lemnae]
MTDKFLNEAEDEGDGSGVGGESGSAAMGGGPRLNPTPNAVSPSDTQGLRKYGSNPSMPPQKHDAQQRYPSIKQLDSSEELPNGFTVGELNGVWYLYDEKERPIGRFTSREFAVAEAARRKSWGGFRM